MVLLQQGFGVVFDNVCSYMLGSVNVFGGVSEKSRWKGTTLVAALGIH